VGRWNTNVKMNPDLNLDIVDLVVVQYSFAPKAGVASARRDIA
jgi:hypothetical protein